ncbi:hypothetical protein [Streptomyces sp. SID2888]|uniref:hypothetical protein n=1 Tax=Streptomyces sp. SID2888 TaxID=2690256 RepID=UPI00136DCB8F|nr:hypothetical protein [Streptomyces sp. SID2888]MYV45181.1 hypothetical protein [Streptomyces sp. SID2888]
MNTLLKQVVDASGGQDLWSRTPTLTAEVSVGGPVWAPKGWAGALRDLTVTVDTRRQHTVIAPFTAPGLSMEFDNTGATALDGVPATGEPQRAVLRDPAGRMVNELTDPRAAFTGRLRATPWRPLHLGYFLGYALWNYLTAPFLLLRPDVLTRELDPWHEAGQTWRRLRVRYPDTLATHSLEQTFYYDSDGLQRRMDYVNEVMGSALVAHYSGRHRSFGGLVLPSRRRTFRRNPDGTSNINLPSITVDVHGMHLGHAGAPTASAPAYQGR